MFQVRKSAHDDNCEDSDCGDWNRCPRVGHSIGAGQGKEDDLRNKDKSVNDLFGRAVRFGIQRLQVLTRIAS